MQCISPQNQTTPEKTLSNPWFGKGFCEPGQYKSAIDRCEGGYRSCELGIDIFSDLVKIMENHAAALRQWSTSSQKQISQSKEFGTTKKVWINSVRAVEKLAERSDQIGQNVKKNVVEEMISYKAKSYGKSFIHVRAIKDFEKEFKKVQRAWLELIEKINDAKKVYHEAKNKLQRAQGAAKITDSDVGSSDEEKQKARLSIETRQKETDRCRVKYENAIKEMDKAKPDYEKQMFKILDSTDEFERERLKHFKKVFGALQEATSLDKDKCHTDMADAFTKAIAEHSIDADIAFFNKNYGRDTKTNWPVFEDLQD